MPVVAFRCGFVPSVGQRMYWVNRFRPNNIAALQFSTQLGMVMVMVMVMAPAAGFKRGERGLRAESGLQRSCGGCAVLHRTILLPYRIALSLCIRYRRESRKCRIRPSDG